MRIATVEQIRNLDKTAITKYKIPEMILMENAGKAVISTLQNYSTIENDNFLVFCSTGNNGGDGMVAARLLHSKGGIVKVFIIGNPNNFSETTKLNYQIIQTLPIEIQFISNTSDIEAISYSGIDMIIDGIFGTGLTRLVEGIYHDLIQSINHSKVPVLSIDIPSGVNAQTGQIMGICIQANATVSFGLLKPGNLFYPGFLSHGELFVSKISFPQELTNLDSIHFQTNDPVPLPVRKEDGHKSSFGKTLFIAGASTYYGAPFLSSNAFIRSGGGYAFLAAPQSMIPTLATMAPEIVYFPMKETDQNSIASDNSDFLIEKSEDMDFIVLGPGLSRHPDTMKLVQYLITKISKPLLIDGDGLFALSENPDLLQNSNKPVILTPHGAEYARLTNIKPEDFYLDIQQNFLDISKNWQSWIVYKGAHSLIADPNGEHFINLSGNSGMASAGSGDVLTGIIAALFGLGFSITKAVRMGVFLHGLAGDIAADSLGQDGISASDILDILPDAVSVMRNHFSDVVKQYKITEV